MTPLQAIRKFCVQCAGSAADDTECGGDEMLGQGDPNGQCWFYPYRMGRGRPIVTILRKVCKECMGGSCKLVAECTNFVCPLHQFRFGTNPNRTRKTDKIPAREGA